MDIETEKAVIEVPCPADGILVRLYVSEGQEIAVGSNVASFLTLEDIGDMDAESRVALHNLRRFDVSKDCRSPFKAYQERIETVKQLAEKFKGLDLFRLDIRQRRELRQTLYQVWHPLAEMRRYALKMPGGKRQRNGITKKLQTEFVQAKDTLSTLLGATQAAARPSVFIGSSTPSLNIAQQVQRELSDEIDCSLWKNDSAFELGKSTLDGLLQAANRYEFGIFVFGADDSIEKDGANVFLPRDNVVFEFGLFLGRLGRDRAYILCDKRSSVLSDLEGIHVARFETHKDLHVALGAPCAQLRSSIKAVWERERR